MVLDDTVSRKEVLKVIEQQIQPKIPKTQQTIAGKLVNRKDASV